MKSKKEYINIVSNILKELRSIAGLPKSRMADLMSIDERTYARYEAGSGAPTLPEFLTLLDRVDAPALPTVLRYLYPESYGPEATTADLRQELSRFILKDASDRDVQQLAYILHGPHGSTMEAQLQLFSAIDHLNMDVRLAIAKLTLNAWEIEQARGKVLNPDKALPDIELLRQAIIKAHQAVIEGRNSYTSALK